MTLRIQVGQVLAEDRHKYGAGLNLLMGFQLSLLANQISNGNVYIKNDKNLHRLAYMHELAFYVCMQRTCIHLNVIYLHQFTCRHIRSHVQSMDISIRQHRCYAIFHIKSHLKKKYCEVISKRIFIIFAPEKAEIMYVYFW